MDTFSWKRPSAMIKMSCWRGFCPVGSRAFATAESSIPFNSFKRFTIGSSAIVLSCLKAKLEIICPRPEQNQSAKNVSQHGIYIYIYINVQKKEVKNKRFWTNEYKKVTAET